MPEAGQIFLVTGATSGLGKETVRGLAKQGGRIIGVGRDAERGARAQAEIQVETDNRHVEYWTFDLSRQAQVSALAERCRQRLPQLDVLVNNVGAVFLSRKLSPDGIEMNLALNHLGVFQLTLELLDLLQTSAAARIVTVSSSAHYRGEMRWDDLQRAQNYNYMDAYGQSKLANVLFTYELARRLLDSKHTTNALHPGFVKTRIGADNGALARLFQPLVFRLMGAKSVQAGARTSLYLATSPEVAGTSGKFFIDEKETESAEASHDLDAALRLWELSLKMTGLADPWASSAAR
jgi:NAD(P)-dependent dehydrogenase (short-subunit alcohol dehydrogenase family)